MKQSVKVLTSIIILTSVIILSGILTLFYLINSAGKLEKDIAAITESVDSEQWEKAKLGLDDFEKKWTHTKYGWAMLIDHFEIDNIENTFTKSKEYIEAKDSPSSLAELAALRQYIKHIPEKEGFSIKNILNLTTENLS